MKRTLMIGLLVLLTISVGMLISCSGEVKVDTKNDFLNYMMKSGSYWFDSFKTTYPDLTKASIKSVTFCKEKPSSITSTGTDLTIENTGKVMGYVSGTDSNYEIYIVGDKIYANYDSSYMFSDHEEEWNDYFYNLTNIDFGNLDTSKVENMYYLLCGCKSIGALDISGFDTSNVVNMGFMFDSCYKLKTITGLSNIDTHKVAYFCGMFKYCNSLQSIDFGDKFDTSSAVDMYRMFYYCTSLTDIDVSSLDTSKVKYMGSMFSGCTSLSKLNLSSFDTSNVKDMSYLFYECTSLTDLTLSSKFDTSKVTNMYGMFCYCYDLQELDLSSFDTSNVTDMCGMFYNCSGLTTITDLSGFNTKKVADMQYMFYKCTSLTDLNLTSFDITTTGTDLRANRPNTDSMFDWWTSGHSVKVATSQVGDGTYGWSIQNNLTGWTSSTDVSCVTYTKPQPE